jgi:molybdate transport system substrate-binding protein
LGSLVVVILLTLLLALDPGSWYSSRVAESKIVVLCAAGLKAPVTRAAREYQERYGVEIQLQYGGSNTLLASLQLTTLADIYIPADDSYVSQARDKQLISEVLPLASMKPVLAVRKGNQKKLNNLDVILASDVKTISREPGSGSGGKIDSRRTDSIRPLGCFF